MAEARRTARYARARAIPLHQTDFVGRKLLLEQLGAAMDRDFAVVLHGPPGIGKSRAAHAFAERWANHREADVWVADLAEARSTPDALASVGATVGLPTDGDAERLRAQIRGVLQNRHALLVLDHAEHLADAVNEWLDEWRCDASRLLVTSRVLLANASTVAVRPFTEDEAIRYVENRVRRTRPSFVADESNRDDIRSLIRAVDALPAALELLAPRLTLLSVEQLLARTSATLDPLQHAIQRSWELLDDRQRSVLSQLAVARGGFDFELAEAFVRTDDDLVSILETLVGHAWLHPVEGARVRLHFLHEPQRYICEVAPNEDAQMAHAAAILRFGEAWDAGIETDRELECTQRLVEELPNLLAAFERTNEPDLRARLGMVLHMALQRGGPFSRQDEITSVSLENAKRSGDDRLVARTLLARARALRWNGDFDGSLAALRESAATAERVGDAHTWCGALRNLAAGSWGTGDMAETRRWAELALEVALEHGTPEDEINARNGMGFLLTSVGELDEARDHLERALQLALTPGKPTGVVALVSSSLANLAMHRHDWLEAERHSARAIAIFEQLDYVRHLPLELLYRAEARILAGRLDDARADIERADRIAQRMAFDTLSIRAAYLQGTAALVEGEAATALEILERAASRLAPTSDIRLSVSIWLTLGAARHRLGDTDGARRAVTEAAARRPAVADEPMAKWLCGNGDASDIQDPLLAAVAGTAARSPVLEVAEDGRSFRFGNDEPVDLTRRKALRGILKALVVRHCESAGDGLTLDEILEAGWPGEKTTAESGARRVYVTIKRLRDMGLDELILTTGDGYMLEPRLVVRAPHAS